MSTLGAWRTLRHLCREADLPEPRREYEFHHSRLWRVDYAWPELDPPLALEVEGGAFLRRRGRHVRGSGFRADLEKYNALTCEGWRLIRVMPEELLTQRTIDLIRRAMLA